MPKVEIPVWQAVRLVSPGPVALVSVKYRDKVNILAVGWTAALSQNPPRVGIAVHPSRYSHDLLRRAGQFGLSIPGRALAEAVARVGSMSGASGLDKTALAGLTWTEPTEIDTPLVAEALAWLECVVVSVIDIGDHSLFVGEVQRAAADEVAYQDGWLLPEDEEKRPLHHLGGDRFALLSDAFTVALPDARSGQ